MKYLVETLKAPSEDFIWTPYRLFLVKSHANQTVKQTYFPLWDLITEMLRL